MPFFSVIIPVYNIENYIECCVESILSQSFNDFEILLIDDGSKDHSFDKCRKIAKKDSRIRVLHKENGGASSARNFGLKKSTGDYIIFVDGDDFLSDKKCFEVISNKINEANYDVVSFNRNSFDEVTKMTVECSDYRKEQDNNLDYLSFIREMIKNDYFYGAVWVLCVSRKFISKNELFFIEGTATEDLDWIIRLLNFHPKIYNLSNVFYTYRTNRNGSVTRSVNCKRQNEYFVMIQNLTHLNYYCEEFKNIIMNYLAYNFVVFCSWNQHISDKKKKKELINKEKDLRYLLKYDLMPQTKKANLISKFFGYRVTDFILGIYLKRKIKSQG